MNDAEAKAVHGAVCRRMADQGRLVEVGWLGYRRLCVPPGASALQVEETRTAFFAGAQHLFGAVIGMLDDDAEPTPNDLVRMDALADELKGFAEVLKAKAKARR